MNQENSFYNSPSFTVSESEVAQPCPTLCNPMDCSLPGSSIHRNFPGKSTGVGCHFLLQEIFPIQGLNPGLPYCRQTLYHVSNQGSPSNVLVRFIIHRHNPKMPNRCCASFFVVGNEICRYLSLTLKEMFWNVLD